MAVVSSVIGLKIVFAMADSGKSSFVYYRDWADELMKLPDDLRLRIDDAVKRYVFYGEEPTDREVLYSMFGLMRARIDRDNAKYAEVRAKRSAAGTAGNRKRWGEQSQKVANIANARNAKQSDQKVANIAVNVNGNVNDNGSIGIDKEETPKGVKRVASLTHSQPSLCDRQKAFYDELVPYVDKYSPELVRSFYDYWSEPDQAGRKMRRELEKTWDTGKRLARWKRNERPRTGLDATFKKTGNYDNENNGTNRRDSSAEQTTLAAASAVAKLLAENE